MNRIKILKGYAAHARYLSTVSDDPVGYIPRQPSIPSPYAYAPTHALWEDESGRKVVIVETAHRRYEVFALGLADRVHIHETEAAAAAAYLDAAAAVGAHERP